MEDLRVVLRLAHIAVACGSGRRGGIALIRASRHCGAHRMWIWDQVIPSSNHYPVRAPVEREEEDKGREHEQRREQARGAPRVAREHVEEQRQPLAWRRQPADKGVATRGACGRGEVVLFAESADDGSEILRGTIRAVASY